MNKFLKRIKLIDHFTIELHIQKREFVDQLKKQVDEAEIGIISDLFDVFSSHRNEYKGKVDSDGFKIKKPRKFFDMTVVKATAIGTYEQKSDRLIIHTEINGFQGIMIPFYLFALVFYSIALVAIPFVSDMNGNTMPHFFVIPFILLHAAFMLGIPYLMMRRSTKRLKYDLEREFYYLTKK